jgi:outer membrane protein assembly factor BamE
MASCSKNVSQIKLVTSIMMGAISVLTMSGCSVGGSQHTPIEYGIVTKIFNPYRADVVQGNFISKEQLETVRPGMYKEQVRQSLGTPLLNDIYHPERWDYVFLYRAGNTGKVEERKVILYFDGLVLKKIDAQPLPTEQGLIDEIDALRNNKKPDIPRQVTGPVINMAPTVPNPTSGVGIPPGGNREDAQ